MFSDRIVDKPRAGYKGTVAIAGEIDIVVTAESIGDAVDDTCDLLKQENWGEPLEAATYSAMNHFPVI